MTDWLDVSAETPRRAYVATAAQQVFEFPFVFFDEADLLVYVDGVLQTLSTDYSTSGEEDEDGGAVTLVDALVGGEIVVISRVLAYELTTHIPPSGRLDIPALNLQLSRFVAMLQQIDANRVRSLHQPDEDEDDFEDLPAKAERLGKFLFFNASTGQPEAAASVTGAAVSSFIETLLDDTSAAAARATLGVTDQSSYAGLSNWHHCG